MTETMLDTWTEEPVPVTPTRALREKAQREAREAAAEALVAHWVPLLAKAAAARDRAAEHYMRKAAVMRTLVKQANDAGVPMTEVAKAANVSRERAHRIYAKAARTVAQGDLLPD